MKTHRFRLGLLAVLLSILTSTQTQAADGLLVRYDFRDGKGNVVHDRSGVGNPLDLIIDSPSNVRWAADHLTIRSATRIVSKQPATKVFEAVRKSNAISVEAWVKPANTSQDGPARVVSISSDTSHRNFTLGQEKDQYDARLRSTRTSTNGIPSTSTPAKSLKTELTHVVFTRDPRGQTRMFVNGRQSANRNVAGDLRNWDRGYRLILGNEQSNDRPWLGEFHAVAIYNRALSANEVLQKFRAGSQADPNTSSPLATRKSPSRFETHIAPLFAEHCLECHDSAIHQGGLDLSKKAAAFAGGDRGNVITPGNAKDSELWQLVAKDEMPHDRAPLSDDEKEQLRKWLDEGAEWTSEAIDPVVYKNEGHAGDVWVQRLTLPEYIATVKAAVDVDISQEAKQLLPPDLRADGFRNTAYNLGIDLKHIEAYSKLAEIIVNRMNVLEFSAKFSKSRKLSTDDTMRDHVAAMGKWLFRGPLNRDEVNQFSGIATTVASAGGDFEEAIRYIVQAMLQSPRFVYRIEHQRGDGGRRLLDSYELASRMSYIVWGAPPDRELFEAADQGRLSSREQIESQLRRMIKDPRTIDRSEQFLVEWFNLDRLRNLRPNEDRFPEWSPKLADDMRRETIAFFREVAWKQNRPLSDLLNAQVTFATPELAKFYDLKPQSDNLARYDLSDVPHRGGLLTQGSVLTIGGDEASMVARGLFVLHDLLRGTINAPPPCVNTTPPPTKTGLTQRLIAEQRIGDSRCGVCHVRFEPLAFGLEQFDGIGAWHERDEHGNPLRSDGTILFPGTAKPIAYTTSAELMDRLADSERVQESLTWKVTQFALGRPLIAADAPLVKEIHQQSQKNGGTYASLISAIVMSDLVQTTRTQQEES
ncbi:DUF1592 domain-containing protein [Thalassoroseus pseudoceratinae]|uniref:DUF1592 domain-containing protein n=1 Tax=Thalassoroseus pseudoceratinae TaxID=2713176 RepID=UPI00141D9E0B|nr:DUF1592 domain-containing protein [Thalassoroseus pseudoceratinae]